MIITDHHGLYRVNQDLITEKGFLYTLSRHRSYWKSFLEFNEEIPSIEWADGSLEWYLHGNLHRTIGPAYIFEKGNKWSFWLCGSSYSLDIWLSHVTYLTEEQKLEIKMRYA